MNHRERVRRILNYQAADRLPIVHFGFWGETLQRWAAEGHIPREQAGQAADGNAAEAAIAGKLGFDFNWQNMFGSHPDLHPYFEPQVVERLPDGSFKERNHCGVVSVRVPGAGSIPAEVDHLLKDRAAWEEHFLPRLQFHPELIDDAMVPVDGHAIPFGKGGRDRLLRGDYANPIGLHLGSLYGTIRGWLTLEGSCYLQADDEALFTEIIDTNAQLSYRYAEAVLATGVRFDFAHFWEDICFKNGPLIHPGVFAAKVGPHYRRLTDLVRRHGIEIVSLDCDGCIDALIPTWVKNGVNTMFPIEVGTWKASLAPWRRQYGRELRGVGGMDKTVFARDARAVNREVERLRPLVDLGGFIPCPDHRIAPDAQWDNVRRYCDRMRKVFG